MKTTEFIYFFISIDQTMVKIGKSANPEQRYRTSLKNNWNIDLNLSFKICIDKEYTSLLEKTIHFLLRDYNLKDFHNGDGKTEWFSIEGLEIIFKNKNYIEIINFKKKIIPINIHKATPTKTGKFHKNNNLTTEPIKSKIAIKRIEMYLKEQEDKRNLILWLIAINSNIPIKDLITLKIKDIKEFSASSPVKFKYKGGVINLSTKVIEIIQEYKKECNLIDSFYLFRSRKGFNNHISTQTVGRLVNNWCNMVGLVGIYGSHSLRKTYNYHLEN
jgi:integrase